MPTFRVRSTDGDNGDNGSTWALAKATINGAITAASDGDDILISKVHYETLVTATDLDCGTKVLNFYVVDEDDNDALVSDYQASTYGEVVSFAGYTYIRGSSYWHGLRFTPQTQSTDWRIGHSSADNGLIEFVFNKCLLSTGGGAYSLSLGYTELGRATYTDCDFDCVDSGTDLGFRIAYGAHVSIIGGSVLATDSNSETGLFTFSTYGGNLKAVGLDMSAQDADLNLVTCFNSYPVNAVFERCILPANWTGSLTGLTTIYAGIHFEMHNCWYEHDAGSLHHILFQIADHCGWIYQETTTVRDATFDGTNKYSAKMVSESDNCGKPGPLRHDLTSVRADWSTKTTVDVYFTSDTALDDSKFWIEGDFPSGASGWTNNKHFSSEVRLSTPTGYSDGQGTWTSGKTYTYKATLTLSGCEEGEANIYACIGKTSADVTIYVCPAVEIS